MIIVVSSSSRESAVLADLCDYRKWPCHACSSIYEFSRLAEKTQPRTVVVRHQLQDGYSDDILALLRARHSPTIKPAGIIVLTSANCSAASEARQIALGADVVLRDPVRIPVLMEYLGKYNSTSDRSSPALVEPARWPFAGVHVHPDEHRISQGEQSFHVAPQEIALLRILNRSQGKVVSYPMLYSELLNRKFGGDTTNCRVLLGKVVASFKKLGINLRGCIQVIPKSGYLYTPPVPAASSRQRLSARPIKRAKRQSSR
mgnify:CR=1 FL=1